MSYYSVKGQIYVFTIYHIVVIGLQHNLIMSNKYMRNFAFGQAKKAVRHLPCDVQYLGYHTAT